MAIYSANSPFFTTYTFSGLLNIPCWEFVAGLKATPNILEVSANLIGNGLGTLLYSLGYSLPGVTDTKAYGLPDNLNDPASKSYLAYTWSAAPNVPSTRLRTLGLLASTNAASMCWTFPRGLVVPSNNSVVMSSYAQSNNGHSNNMPAELISCFATVVYEE